MAGLPGAAQRAGRQRGRLVLRGPVRPARRTLLPGWAGDPRPAARGARSRPAAGQAGAPAAQRPRGRAGGADRAALLPAAGPLLIAIDDAQWLDAASLGALTFALRRVTTGPLTLLLAARTEAPADPLTAGAPPLPHGWRTCWPRCPGRARSTLAPLDTRQVQRLLPPDGHAPPRPGWSPASRAGNPFWARESRRAWSPPSTVPPLARR